jgi:hypothetical protein
MKWIDAAADLLSRMASSILFAMMLLTMTDVVLSTRESWAPWS